MKTRFYFLTLFIILFSNRLFAQSDFRIYTFQTGWGPKAEALMAANPKFDKMIVFTQGTIAMDNDTVLSVDRLTRNLNKNYPDKQSSEMLLLDWEGKMLKYLRDQPVTSSKFKYAENQYLELLAEIRRQRPNLKISLYGMPFRFFNDWQKQHHNIDGKLDKILAKTDFISPSVYPLYPDEQKNIGHERNLQYYRENTEAALIYGKRLGKPVIPLVWHRLPASNKTYSNQIIRPEVMAKYIHYISTLSVNGYKISGVAWWENLGINKSVKFSQGVGNLNNGFAKDKEDYDLLQVEYLKNTLEILSKSNPATKSSFAK